MKKKKKWVAGLFLFLIPPIFWYIPEEVRLLQLEKPILQDLPYEDFGEFLSNPERGWYLMNGYLVQKNGDTKEEKEKAEEVLRYQCEYMKESGDRLFEYQIQLKNLVPENLPIPEKCLEDINEQFSMIREYGLQLIIRPLYDWEGKAKPEPEFQTILGHVRQLSELFARNEDIILCVEAGFLGPFGEWHSTKYNGVKYQRKILEEYFKYLPDSLQVSVRCPRFYREIFETDEPITEESAFSKLPIARVGFYNDGFLGSESDLGTYTSWSREEELAFQESHNRYLVFGGEATLITEYGELFHAISDMRQTHCTYLNKEHYLPLKEFWKESIYEGEKADEKAYIGKNGYDYIRDHLGYRFVLKGSYLSESVKPGRMLKGKWKVENVGFGNLLKEKTITLLLVQGNLSYSFPLETDIRTWQAGKITEQAFQVRLPESIPEGEWEVYLQIQGENKVPVQFANPDLYDADKKATLIGRMKVP